MRKNELYMIFFIIFVNFVYFVIVFSTFSIAESKWYMFTWLAEWLDYKIILMRSSKIERFQYLFEFPVLVVAYLIGVGQAAVTTRSLMASRIPFLLPFHYHVIYMGLLNVLFEIITVILTMRLVSRYFERIYASNIMFIFILLPVVWWITISRWELLPMAFIVSTLYFAVENRPWYAWISITIAILTKFYPILFTIPLIWYYFERDGFKKTVIYVGSILALTVLIHIPFYLIFGTKILSGIFFQATRISVPYSIWYWIFLISRGNELVSVISVWIQVGSIFIYVLADYFYEIKKENPLSTDRALIKRFSIVSLIFLLTFKMAGYQYVVYAFPFVLIFMNCFKKFTYFAFWIIAYHITTYLTIIIYGLAFLSKRLEVTATIFFSMSITYVVLYMVAIALIHFNKNLYENRISILNDKEFILQLYHFVKKEKSHK